MTGLGDRLTEKLGPLPVWAWGLGAGGIILGGQYLLSRRNASPPSDGASVPGPSVEAAPTASPAADDSGLSFVADGSYVPPNTAPALPGGGETVQPLDNDEWLRLAVVRVSSRDGSLPVLLIEGALSKYLNGQPLTEQESNIVELAIRTIGPTPYPAPPVTVIPTVIPQPNPNPTPTPAPVPATPVAPAVPTHTIVSGDTLWGVVKAHYGSVTTVRVRNVAAANGLAWIDNGTKVTPWRIGQVIKLPPGM